MVAGSAGVLAWLSRSWGRTRLRVFGMVERGDRSPPHTMPNLPEPKCSPDVEKRVLPPQSMIYTDEYSGYSGLAARWLTYERANHSGPACM